MAAAHLGLPVVDAEMMGAAIRGQMTESQSAILDHTPVCLRPPRAIEGVVAKRSELEGDEREPQRSRRARLDRLDLQGAAHRRGSKDWASTYRGPRRSVSLPVRRRSAARDPKFRPRSSRSIAES